MTPAAGYTRSLQLKSFASATRLPRVGVEVFTHSLLPILFASVFAVFVQRFLDEFGQMRVRVFHQILVDDIVEEIGPKTWSFESRGMVETKVRNNILDDLIRQKIR